MSRTTTYATDSGELVIEFDYQPEEDATDVSPGDPELVEICSVMAGEFEILELCSEESIELFKDKCLESIKFEHECAQCDRADARSEE